MDCYTNLKFLDLSIFQWCISSPNFLKIWDHEVKFVLKLCWVDTEWPTHIKKTMEESCPSSVLWLLQNYDSNILKKNTMIVTKFYEYWIYLQLLNVDLGAKFRTENVELSHFYTNKDITRLINETEVTFTNELEGGDRQKAMKRLRVPPLGEKQSPWTTFKVGLFSGSFVVLFIAVILSGNKLSLSIYWH